MNIENRCPYCWDTCDPLDQGGNAATDYNVNLVRCCKHAPRKDIPPYLHLWDEARTLDLGEFREDWTFTKKVHSILANGLGISLAEFQWSCAENNADVKHEADLLAKVIAKEICNENIEQFLRRDLLSILQVEEESREDDFLKLVIKYYLFFNLKSGLARVEAKTMKPFRSFEYHLLDREYKQLNWAQIIYTGEFE